MASLIEEPYHSFREVSLSDEGAYDARALSRPAHLSAKPAVTVEKLRDILDELRRNIAADIGLFREEIRGVSARLQNTEPNTAAQET
ncbi:Hypothetical predicted protein [Pelobates cultripes]|uniref:Uncharacterized protein n=1 Tax=Pelobates cultripes TaxID=61616 RepID=A0AAD1RG00_PELCU|nr:Hypothetical predicted protein [Pelobates cultripes]